MNLDPLVNTVIDERYAITSRLARGGMASVYRAHDKRLERDVAVKIIHSHLAEQPDFVDRFIREARSAAKLASQHVVNVYDQGVAHTPLGDLPYLVMQLIDGPDLRSQLNLNGSLPLGTALSLTRQVLLALATAHRADVIHRDVKPENILLSAPLSTASVLAPAHVQAQVADFGLARVASSSTQTSTVLGTVAYVAPELVTSGTSSPAADIYATGIMLYELIAGSLPFTGETPLAIAYQHVNNDIPQLSDLAEWIPAGIDSLIRLFTAKDPQKRPQNGDSALAALDDIVESIPEDLLIRRIPVFPPQQAGATPHTTQLLDSKQPPVYGTQKIDTLPQATQVHAQKQPRRRRWPIVLTLLMALVVIAGSIGWYFLYGPGLRITIANVTSLSVQDAQKTLEKQGFSVVTNHEFSDTVGKDRVITTKPGAGTRIHPDSRVTIVVSDGIKRLTVPTLTGLSAEDAAQTLKKVGFSNTSHTSEYSDTVEKNMVISQNPNAKTSLPHNAKISYVISKGRAPVKVPDLSQVTRDQLEATVSETGLKLVITEEFSDTVAEGKVISQTPKANADAHRLDELHVTISRGPELVPIPKVVGQQRDAAIAALKAAGFDVKVESILGGYFGTVRLQNPDGGEKAKRGTTITITVV